MRVPLSWLKEYIKVDLSNEALADVLTLAGMEVDRIEAIPPSLFKGVVVGEVKEVLPHPRADALKIVRVFDGTEVVQVVCGDLSCRVGTKAPFARVGALLADEAGGEYEIECRALRGVESFGMLCSERELGFSDRDVTIMHLEGDVPTGADLRELFGDVVIEMSLTPNLGHCMSIFGVARDLAALLNQKVKAPEICVEENGEKTPIHVEIKDSKQCYRYSCRLIRNVKVASAPSWMKMRLKSAGMRTTNNVVDILNYVMLELGQPLHAFDYSKLSGGKIVVRPMEGLTFFKSIDNVEREIPSGILMVCDAMRPLAIAGVMGGVDSEITGDTEDVLLEAAHFDRKSVRKGSKRLGIRSESSIRFERGVDHAMVPVALDLAAALIAKIAGGDICAMADFETEPARERKVTLRISRVKRLLGIELSQSEIEGILQRLGMNICPKGECVEVSIPSFRNDLKYDVDIIEEVARIYGYNNIKRGENRVINSTLPCSRIYPLGNCLRGRFVSAGLQEFVTSSLIGPKLADLSLEKSLGEKEEVHLLNPPSVDQSILRTSLLPGMLQVAKHNFDHRHFDISAFEVGYIYFKDGGGYKERATAGVLLTGRRTPLHWDSTPQNVDFFDLKGIVENVLEGLFLEHLVFESSDFKSFHPGEQALLRVGDLRLGVLGEVHPRRLPLLGIKERIFFAQIDLHDLFELKGGDRPFSPLPLFPGSERDWTVTLRGEVSMAELFAAIDDSSSKLLKNRQLLSIYRNEKLGKKRKNVTFRFFYRSDRHTLRQEQVEREHAHLIAEVEKKIGDFIC